MRPFVMRRSYSGSAARAGGASGDATSAQGASNERSFTAYLATATGDEENDTAANRVPLQ